MPRGWVVGFNVVCNNGRSFYVETEVLFDEAQSDEDAVNVALEKLREDVYRKVDELEKKSLLIGKRISL
jgi:hypothetical protein